MKTIRVRGHEVAYVQDGSGPPLVFLHNGGTSHSIWIPVMERLRDQHTVVATDLLGFGASDRPTDCTMELYVDQLQELVTQLGLDSPVVVGNCMGSAIAVTWARRNRGTARGLLLINPLTRDTLNAGRLGMFARFRTALPSLSRGVYGVVGRLRLPRWTARPVLATQLGESGRQQGLQKHEPLVACHASSGQLRSLLDVLDDLDAYAALDREASGATLPPSWVLWGGQNRILDFRAGEAFRAAIQPACVDVIPEGGHLVMLEEPDRTAGFIRRFIASLGEEPAECEGRDTERG